MCLASWYLCRALPLAGSRVPVLLVSHLVAAAVSAGLWLVFARLYVCLRSAGRDHLKEETLAELEALLDPARFVRIHRSYILNPDRLARVELYARDSRVAILHDGTKLPVSRAGYARLSQLL
jgi:DNA-binding LytR/AlgR family response regulator